MLETMSQQEIEYIKNIHKGKPILIIPVIIKHEQKSEKEPMKNLLAKI